MSCIFLPPSPRPLHNKTNPNENLSLCEQKYNTTEKKQKNKKYKIKSRSSGAGGQNVNKVSTKVEIRFVVEDADWLPDDVKIRLSRQQRSRVNKDGELVVTSQEFR